MSLSHYLGDPGLFRANGGKQLPAPSNSHAHKDPGASLTLAQERRCGGHLRSKSQGPKVSYSSSSWSLHLLLGCSPKFCLSPSLGIQSPACSPRFNQETLLPPISGPAPKNFNLLSLQGLVTQHCLHPPWSRTPRPLYLTPVFLPFCIQDTERPRGQNALIEAVTELWCQDGDSSSHRD